MELVYVWVGQVAHGEAIEICFSNRYLIKKNDNKIVVQKKRNVLPENFFESDSIINVHAIVGENGVGKTSFFKFISLEWPSFYRDSIVFIEQNDGSLLVWSDEKYIFETNEIETKQIYSLKNIEIYIEEKIARIFFSLSLDQPYARILPLNLSTSSLMNKFNSDVSIVQTFYGNYTGFHYTELKKQIKFINEIGSGETLGFEQSLSHVKVFYNNSDTYDGRPDIPFFYVKMFKVIEKISDLIKAWGKGIDDDDSLKINAGKVILILRILNDRMRFDNYLEPFKENKSGISFYDTLKIDELVNIDDIDLFLHKTSDMLSNIKCAETIDDLHIREYDSDICFINFIIENLNSQNFSLVSFSWEEKNQNTSRLQFVEFKVSVKNIEWFVAYVESLNIRINYGGDRKRTLTSPIFKFSWGLSTGEYAAFSLVSRLYDVKADAIKNHSNGKREAIWLFLDEIEISFHPDWQRKIINYLIKKIPIIFPGINIQLFLSTHSPIILSDIPRCNVSFLRKPNSINKYESIDQETFGANIHTLYSKGFFLDSLIGEFAKKKIQSLIDRFKNIEEEDVEDLQKHIDLIGEPILKSQLQKMLNTKRNESEVNVLKDQVKDLQERIKRLEGGKND